MGIEFKEKTDHIQDMVRALEELRRFDGNPPEFWAGYMDTARRLSESEFAVLMIREMGEETFKPMGVWPTSKRKEAIRQDMAHDLEQAAGDADNKGACSMESPNGGSLIGVRLDTGDDASRAVALFFVSSLSLSKGLSLDERLTRLELVADIPLVYTVRKQAEKARNDVVRFADTLDLMVLLNREKRYMAGVMTFVNELASRFNCSRVSLGWLEKGYVRVQGISHMEQFEKKMEAVQLMEAAMEETLDQDEEIVFPQPEGLSSVVRAHGEFAKKQGGAQLVALPTQGESSKKMGGTHLVSLPIRPDDEPLGVLLCEREGEPFSENDMLGLRLFCDQAARRLYDLKTHDVWFGKRMVRSLRESLAKLLGVDNTFAKAVGILCFLLMAFLLFGRLEYRVEAPFTLKTDDVAYLPTPFEGYIKTVYVQVGDEVAENQLLLSLDTQELLIEESSAIADKSRYAREAEKARARYALAEMKIAQALKEQSEAKLALIRYHLTHADVKAPFAGIVVEGDLKEMLGAPVRKGDVLFKVARIERLYAELDIDERDVHELTTGNSGEIAFVSKPEHSYDVSVDRIDPVAIARDEGNVFPVRCDIEGAPESWWRPGMSGISKINVGKRNVFWILTHRTVEFLRLFFWW